MSHLLLLVLLANLSLTPSHEATGPTPDTLYDFWIGEWDLTWTDKDGQEYQGRNTIRKVMNDLVIEEHFVALDGELEGYEGKSWSVYSPTDGWKQTWVDNQGAYLDFTGKAESRKRMFYRVGRDSEGNELHSRMVFYNITGDSFDWDWQASKDKGGRWDTLWAVHYQRKGS